MNIASTLRVSTLVASLGSLAYAAPQVELGDADWRQVLSKKLVELYTERLD